MSDEPQKITLGEWEARYKKLSAEGMEEPWYGGSLSRHIDDGDFRLSSLYFDNSAASLRLWNFLLTEEDRLTRRARGLSCWIETLNTNFICLLSVSRPKA